jgi:hypothetical protein
LDGRCPLLGTYLTFGDNATRSAHDPKAEMNNAPLESLPQLICFSKIHDQPALGP